MFQQACLSEHINAYKSKQVIVFKQTFHGEAGKQYNKS